MRRSRTVVVTSIVLVTVLGLLSLIGYVGVTRLRHSAAAVRVASERLRAVDAVESGLTAEAVAEAGYLRSPSTASRERVLATLGDVQAALSAVRRTGAAQDVDALSVLARRYADALRAEVGGPRQGKATGAALDALQVRVGLAVRREERELRAATDNQRRLLQRMAWRAPLALVLAFIALSLSWALLVGYGRRAATRAAASEELALRDSLTGLGNRRAFERVLWPELASDEPDSAVLLVDLDGFKSINDTWGHDIGDEVLRAVAGRLAGAVRATDFVARLGGDEFAVLSRPASQAEALRVRLEQAVTRPLQVSNMLLHLGVSIGSAAVRSGSTQAGVLREADQRLYEQKRAHLGTNRRRGPRNGASPAREEQHADPDEDHQVDLDDGELRQGAGRPG